MDNSVVITGYGISCSDSSFISDSLHDNMYVGHVDDKLGEFWDLNQFRRMDNFSKHALLAAKLAQLSSLPHLNTIDSSRLGTIFSTVWGPMVTIDKYMNPVIEKNPLQASPLLFPYTVTNAAVGIVARLLEAKGVSTMLTGCCPLQYSYEILKQNKADIIITGGVDTVNDLFYKETEEDKFRDSFSGSAAIVMERKETALKRGATILGEFCNYETLHCRNLEKLEKLGTKSVARLLENLGKNNKQVTKVLNIFDTGDNDEKIHSSLQKILHNNGIIHKMEESFQGISSSLGAQTVLNSIKALHSIRNNKKEFILGFSMLYGGNFNMHIFQGVDH